MTQMGDISSAQVSDVGSTQQDHPTTDNTGITGGPLLSQGEPRVIPEHAPCTQPQQPPAVSEHAFTAQFDMSQLPMGARPGPYNMAPMANALPPVTFRPGQYPHATQQRYNPTSPPPMMQQMPQFAGHPSVSITGQGYYLQQPQMAQYYGNHMPQPQVASSIPSRQNMAYYPNQMVMSPQQSTYYYPHTSQYQTSAHPVPTAIMAGHYYGGNPGANDPRAMQPGQTPEVGEVHPQPLKYGQGTPGKQSAVSSELKHGPDGAERRQSAVRGPPRKPRQSGHAIWIGNLPPQTDLMNLVHHVCKETLGLESLFLISKSNCAFANFKDEESCTAAQQKLHDSKFESVRLVSRLRKSTVEGAAGVTAPTGPAVVVTTPKPDQVPDSTPTQNGNPSPATESMVVSSGPPRDTIPQKDKFFILKSLTVEDLELSVRTGIWATQSHNEDTLNNAFKAGSAVPETWHDSWLIVCEQAADSVYLVFSANKSGEYFGYARMVSQINEDPEAAIEFAPTTQAASDLDLPKAIPTEATEHAPKGRIIDDSARGTIFWEAEREDSEGISDVESDISSSKSNGGEESTAKTWGKPFKLEWLSTSRLPFYRTRGLRNPWNSNREVKIARDGTELEPSVGRRLIGLFNRIQSPGPIHAGMRMPLAAIPGFPPMRPYGQ